ncbi:hypothetical protein CLCR_10996 [Cladophialophora carrionii]|uniref:Uncharacterized protein n=1 Tax=Cladophialophora carrionii TaxID=86049 RepID=A0A1C1CYQ9_9EURO|nr:hypothetical protein CLCR_10996 [Cladophialophora carrionii]
MLWCWIEVPINCETVAKKRMTLSGIVETNLPSEIHMPKRGAIYVIGVNVKRVRQEDRDVGDEAGGKARDGEDTTHAATLAGQESLEMNTGRKHQTRGHGSTTLQVS